MHPNLHVWIHVASLGVAGVTIEYVNWKFCWLSSSRSFRHYDKAGLTSIIETGLILHIYCVRYSLENPFKFFFLVFSYFKNFKFAWCLGGFHLRVTLSLLKYGLLCSCRMHAQPSWGQKLYPISFSGFFLTNMIDNYLFSVLNELRSLFYW